MKFLLALLTTVTLSLSDSIYDQVKFKGTSKYFKKPFGKLSTFYPNVNTDATLPLLMFYTGFGSNFPAIAYTDVLQQLSQKLQMVVVCWDGTLDSNPLDQPSQLRKAALILDFLVDGSFTRESNSKITINQTSVFFGAHSSGNQLAVLMASKVGARGLVMLDPVDKDPFGLVKQVIPPPPQTLNYTNPVLIVWATRSELSGGMGVFPACSPAGHNAPNFYSALASAGHHSAKFMLEAVDYGHNDFFDDAYASISHTSNICGSVVDARKNPYSKYRGYITGSAKTFVDAVLGIECNANSDKLLKQRNVNSKIESVGNLCA